MGIILLQTSHFSLFFLSLTKVLACLITSRKGAPWLLFVIRCISHCEYLSLLIGYYNVSDQSTGPEYSGLLVLLQQINLLHIERRFQTMSPFDKHLR